MKEKQNPRPAPISRSAPPPTSLPHPFHARRHRCHTPVARSALSPLPPPHHPCPCLCPVLPCRPPLATPPRPHGGPVRYHDIPVSCACFLQWRSRARSCASTTSTARPSAVLLSAAIQAKPRKGASTAVHGISAIYTSIRSPGSTHLQHRRLDPTSTSVAYRRCLT